jgi:hypothetical protein
MCCFCKSTLLWRMNTWLVGVVEIVALFGFAQRRSVPYRRFQTAYRSHLQGSRRKTFCWLGTQSSIQRLNLSSPISTFVWVWVKSCNLALYVFQHLEAIHVLFLALTDITGNIPSSVIYSGYRALQVSWLGVNRLKMILSDSWHQVAENVCKSDIRIYILSFAVLG